MEDRLSPIQLTRDEAIAFVSHDALKTMTPKERGLFQLRQELLCMSFSQFHEGAQALLGRPVWSHEFADPDSLWREYQGIEDKPDFAGIIAKLPPHLRDNVIVLTPGEREQDDGK